MNVTWFLVTSRERRSDENVLSRFNLSRKSSLMLSRDVLSMVLVALRFLMFLSRIDVKKCDLLHEFSVENVDDWKFLSPKHEGSIGTS